jgi:hypothetical protein
MQLTAFAKQSSNFQQYCIAANPVIEWLLQRSERGRSGKAGLPIKI